MPRSLPRPLPRRGRPMARRCRLLTTAAAVAAAAVAPVAAAAQTTPVTPAAIPPRPPAPTPPVGWGFVISVGGSLFSALLNAGGSVFTPAPGALFRVVADETHLQWTVIGRNIGATSAQYSFSGGIGAMRTNPATGSLELIPGTACWNWDLTVNEQSETINDKVSFNGQVTHVCRPSGHANDAAAGPMFRFGYTVDADDAVSEPGRGFVATAGQSDEEPHPSDHWDAMRSTAEATVTSTLFFDDITGYTMAMDVIHTPEPSALTLAAVGLAAVGVVGVRRRRLARPPGA